MDGAKNAMYAQAGRSHSWSKVQPVSIDVAVVPQPAAIIPMPEPPVVELPDFMLVDTALDLQLDFIKPQDKCQELAMAFVKTQKWQELYEAEHGFSCGTIFAELNLPFMGKGACRDE